MPERVLHVVKWLDATPVLAICASCNRQFKVPTIDLWRMKDAHESLQQQFDRHVCLPNDSSGNEIKN
jgi:hypothetical protein